MPTYVHHPRQSCDLLNYFLETESDKLSEALARYEKFHGDVGETVEVNFYFTSTEKATSVPVPANVKNYDEVVNYNFARIAETKKFIRTLLLVHVKL